MSQYVNRVGQQIGSWKVVADHKRSKRGVVIWRLVNRETCEEKYLATHKVIRLAREHGSPKPGGQA